MHASPVPSLARQTSCAGPGRAGQPCPLPALPPPSPVLPGTWDWLLCQLFALVPSTDSQTTTTNSLEAKCSPHVWRSRSLSRTSLRSKQPHPAQQRFMYTRPTPDYLLVQPQPLLDREPVPVPGRLGRAVPTHRAPPLVQPTWSHGSLLETRAGHSGVTPHRLLWWQQALTQMVLSVLMCSKSLCL